MRIEVGFRILLILIGFLFPASGYASPTDDACFPNYDIGKGKIGQLELGSYLSELSKEHNVVTARSLYADTSYTNNLHYQVTICHTEISILVQTEADGLIVALSTPSQLFSTSSGAKVGMSIRQLQALHPEGTISTGVEESGWVAFQLKDISGFFEFEILDVEFSCLLDNLTCSPDFYERPSIRYWVGD
ncbi:MAG: hypothetical protein L3J04_01440 [Robiginitomaculum sp.]|nr:hypothetical protein [Robiginitomaculum sp.]